MNARGKLNAAFVNGSIVLAAVTGYAFSSWTVFLVVLAAGIALSFYLGDIRPSARKRSH